MGVLIRQTNGPDRAGAVFTDQPIDSSTIVIGSAADADIRLLSDSVAPNHCTIRVSEKSSKLTCSSKAHTVATEESEIASLWAVTK